jgi:metal-responsive CopG/Arc/MetJ family transcriptional regulator
MREVVLRLVYGENMRATVSLDDDLLRTAEEYSGLTERAALIRAALKSLIARECASQSNTPAHGRR